MNAHSGDGDARVSLEFLSGFCGLTPRRVQQLADEGVMVRSGHGEYLLMTSLREYIKYLQTTRRASSSRAREEILIEQSRKLRIQNNKSEGLSIDMAEIIPFLQQLFGLIRVELLNENKKIAMDLSEMDSPSAVSKTLREYNIALLERLSDKIASGFGVGVNTDE
jgi:hypothetical protein